MAMAMEAKGEVLSDGTTWSRCDMAFWGSVYVLWLGSRGHVEARRYSRPRTGQEGQREGEGGYSLDEVLAKVLRDQREVCWSV